MRVSQLYERCGSPHFWEEFHAVMATIWLVNIPIALATSIKASLPYLIVVSLLTAFSGEMSAMHGSRSVRNLEKP